MKKFVSKDSFEDLGFAKLDVSRESRTGTSEAVYCAGKTSEQLLKILRKFRDKGCRVLGTKCSKEQAEFIANAGEKICYDELSRTISLADETPARQNRGRSGGKAAQTVAKLGPVAVCCAGTADLPIAEEAAKTLEFNGVKVLRQYDVGIAGLHRLLSKVEDIRKASVVIAVAGMEGALPGVIAGLVKAPVIAVPTSVGYGASFGGISALLTMLNTCAEGVTVVNIDNGFGAAIAAFRMLKVK
ncbi:MULTISPECIES: nickel pincer cofactor biosynthesis protein LarB [unclassified Fibrobacter]|uniref:nickel pincer cofactor biosynthesis protein LarB n=1 Tax=unclassified Fibrobacter TaxID=2634177 RepID=UPI0025C0462A|nr:MULTISPECIES: nickel pincer cofactor biosynthesis protein LarB [unclassified Fibrobacter]